MIYHERVKKGQWERILLHFANDPIDLLTQKDDSGKTFLEYTSVEFKCRLIKANEKEKLHPDFQNRKLFILQTALNQSQFTIFDELGNLHESCIFSVLLNNVLNIHNEMSLLEFTFNDIPPGCHQNKTFFTLCFEHSGSKFLNFIIRNIDQLQAFGISRENILEHCIRSNLPLSKISSLLDSGIQIFPHNITLLELKNYINQQPDGIIKRKFLNTLSLFEKCEDQSEIADDLKHSFYAKLYNQDKNTLLLECAEQGYEDECIQLLSHGSKKSSDVNNQNNSIWHIAAKMNLLRIIDCLNPNDSNKERLNSENETPWMIAVLDGNLDIAKKLVKKNANVSVVLNEHGHTLLHNAVLSEDDELLDDCLEAGASVENKDYKGYSPLYYAIIKNAQHALERFNRIKGIKKVIAADLHCAVRHNDISSIDTLIRYGVDCNVKSIIDRTPLDTAYIVGAANAAEYLRQRNAKCTLDPQTLDKYKQAALGTRISTNSQYRIKFQKNSFGMLLSLAQVDKNGNIFNEITLNPWSHHQALKTHHSWKVLTKAEQCYIMLTQEDEPSQNAVICEAVKDGSLILRYANLPKNGLIITTVFDFTCDAIAHISDLSVNAKNISFSPQSKLINGNHARLDADVIQLSGILSFNEIHSIAKQNLHQSGELITHNGTFKAGIARILGQIIATNQFNFDIDSLFDLQGQLIAAHQGYMKAHSIQIQRNAVIQSEQGRLELHASCRLSHSGAILGSFVNLESGLMLNINHGAMVKALTCITNAPQFNQTGFLLTGQKNSLSYIDWGLNLAHASVNIAEICSYIPAPNAVALRSCLLIAKTLYRGGEILYRLYQEESVNSSELVTLVLDNVIPSIGALTSNEEKARLLVNLLYQFYGNSLSEDDFIQKSLSFTESLAQGLGLFSFGMISGENAQWLIDASKMIRGARVVLRAADLSASIYQAWNSQNEIELENAHTVTATLAEALLRETLYSLSPHQLLGYSLPIEPRELALFILNQGHTSDLFLQSLVYGILHSAGKSGLIDPESITNLDLLARATFRTKHWTELCQAYQNKRLTANMIANEAINTLMLASGIYSKIIHTHEELSTDKIESAEPIQTENPGSEKLTIATSETKTPRSDEFTISATEIEPNVEMTPEELDAKKAADIEEYKQNIPTYEKQVVTIDIQKMVEEDLAKNHNNFPEKSNFEKLTHTLMTIQKAINGEYAAHGHLAAFVSALHNEGIIETSGNIGINSTLNSTNNSTLKATGTIDIKSTIESTFTNYELGTIAADEAINLICVGFVENYGLIHALSEVTAIANHIIRNYQDGKIVSSEDVTLLCEQLAQNEGIIIGKEVYFEGKKQAAKNTGSIIGIEKIRMLSMTLVNHALSGKLTSQHVSFETSELRKEGAIQAGFVQTRGHQSERPESVSWRQNNDDNVTVLQLKANQPLNYDTNAFQNVKILDVTISTPLDSSVNTLFNIDPTFSNLLQCHFGQSDANLSIWQLPSLASEATLIIDAPGSTLSATQSNIEYGNTLYFVGDKFIFSSESTTFTKSANFDVKMIQGVNASSRLLLNDGGFLQADTMSNLGSINSKGILHWNVKELQNNAQTENITQYFQHSNWYKVYQPVVSTKVVKDSGTIHALGHVGYIGKFSQLGGKFTSDEKGNFIYFDESQQEAIGTQEAIFPDYAMADTGQHWYFMPTWQNAEVGSKGENILLGSNKMNAEGLSAWGDEGLFLYAVNNIQLDSTKQQYYVIEQTESRKASGKIQHVVRPREVGYIPTSNDVSSNSENIALVSHQGSVHLTNTTLSAVGNTSLIAQDEVTLSSIATEHHQSSKYKKKRFLKSKSISSSTQEERVYSSFIFTGGTLIVRCTDLSLDAAKGVIGNADILANNTTLKGRKQTSHTKTITKEFSIGLPTDGLVSILKSHNAKAVFQSLLNNLGWDQHELDTLLHAKSVSEIPKPLLNVSRNAWNISALVAHACNEWGDSPASFVGTFTDQMGLTTLNKDGNRIFNPKFTINSSKTTEETFSTQMISTNLTVGGTFRLTGNKLNLFDGAQIDAEHLRVFLTEGIKATKAVDTYSYSRHTKSHSVGINPIDLTDVSASIALNSVLQNETNTKLSSLNARESVFIKAQHEISGDLKISGKSGEVCAPEMDFTTSQNTKQMKGKNVGVNASTKGAFGGNLHSNYLEEAITSEKAGINLRNGRVVSNRIKLNNGSKITANTLSRADDAPGLPTITGTAGHDYSRSKNKGVSFNFSPNGEPGASLEYSSTSTDTIHRPTVLASNANSIDLPGINTDQNLETEKIRSKKKAIAVSGFIPNLEKTKKDVQAIKKATEKGLLWLYGNNQSTSNQSTLFDEAQLPLPQTLTESFVEEHLAKALVSPSESDLQINSHTPAKPAKKVNKVVKKIKSNNKKVEKPEIQPKRSARLAEKAVQTQLSNQIQHSELELSTANSALIGVGRSLTKTGQGIKQFGLALGEKMGLVEKGRTAKYTDQINEDARLYDSTLVGKSTAGKIGEISTDIGLAVAVPGGVGAKGVKFIAGAAASGAALGTVEPTNEGSISSHAKNAAKGAAEGAIGATVVNKGSKVIHYAFDKMKKTKPSKSFSQRAIVSTKPKKDTAEKPSTQRKSTSSGYAQSANAKDPMKKKMSALQKAQSRAVKTKEFPDGKVRYYSKERPAKTPGISRGSSYVTEYDKNTGQVRSWNETYDHTGKVNRIHPKMINGQGLIAQHYPLTGKELNHMSNTPKKRK